MRTQNAKELDHSENSLIVRFQKEIEFGNKLE